MITAVRCNPRSSQSSRPATSYAKLAAARCTSTRRAVRNSSIAPKSSSKQNDRSTFNRSTDHSSMMVESQRNAKTGRKAAAPLGYREISIYDPRRTCMVTHMERGSHTPSYAFAQPSPFSAEKSKPISTPEKKPSVGEPSGKLDMIKFIHSEISKIKRHPPVSG